MKDAELIRLAGIFKLFEEAIDRLYKMRRQLGEGAFARAEMYLSMRVGWIFDEIRNAKNE